MLSCLTDYIGVEGCSGTVPKSGRYINELPGINLELISSLADDDQQTFNGVWDDIQSRAIRRFAKDARAILAKRYMLSTININQSITQVIDTSTTVSASAQLRGLILETRDKNSDFSCSNLQRFYIQSVRFYATDQQDIVVSIFDLDTGTRLSQTTLASASVTANAWNTVDILDSFEATRIFIGVDCTNFDTVYLNITDNRSAAWYGSCYLDINGAYSSVSSSVSSVTEGINGYGVSPIFSLECSFDRLICNNLRIFEQAFMLCLGIELLEERIFGLRLSEFTQFDMETARENRKLFMVQYQGGAIDDVYQKGELSQAVEGINLSTSDICLECNDHVNYLMNVGV